jgi:ribose 5-phosphate isomerase B
MRIAIGADHAGFELKQLVKAHLAETGHDVADLGTFSDDSVDYPVYAGRVARAVVGHDADLGILVCGSGLGMAIAANKVRGARAVQVTDPEFAKMARLHNDANVLALAGRYTDPITAMSIVDTFLNTSFEGGRHAHRIEGIATLEEENKLR